MTTTRKQYSPKFKARVAVEAIRGEKTLSRLGSQFKVHPIQIAKWRKSASDEDTARGFRPRAGVPTTAVPSRPSLKKEPALGQTIIEKLEGNADRCDSAVIVMTGDDIANLEEPRVRENAMHETGFFQSRFGRRGVVLRHEERVNIPTNLTGLVYIPFPKGRTLTPAVVRPSRHR